MGLISGFDSPSLRPMAELLDRAEKATGSEKSARVQEFVKGMQAHLSKHPEVTVGMLKFYENAKERISQLGSDDSIKQLNRSLDQEIKRDKKEISTLIQGIIEDAYAVKDFYGQHEVERSLGQWRGSSSKHNVELKTISEHVKKDLSTNELLNDARRTVELIELAFDQRGLEMPEELAEVLDSLRTGPDALQMKKNFVEDVKYLIELAYSFSEEKSFPIIGTVEESVVVRSLGKHYGSQSAENKQLNAIKYDIDRFPLSKTSGSELAEQGENVVGLIRKAFTQINQEIPATLERKLLEVEGRINGMKKLQ